MIEYKIGQLVVFTYKMAPDDDSKFGMGEVVEIYEEDGELVGTAVVLAEDGEYIVGRVETNLSGEHWTVDDTLEDDVMQQVIDVLENLEKEDADILEGVLANYAVDESES